MIPGPTRPMGTSGESIRKINRGKILLSYVGKGAIS